MFSVYIKIVSSITLLAASFGFQYDILPPYQVFTEFDKLLWFLSLHTLAFLQIALLGLETKKHHKRNIWSNFVLQLSGLAFILLAAIFSAKYPPFTWAMIVFPTIGITYLFIGRCLTRKSRTRLREYNGTKFTNPY